jgi:hypothetical protein
LIRVDRGAGAATGARSHGKATLPRFRYLWWPEFQLRGALHYHLILVDPPFQYERDARKWFDAHWKSADGQNLAGIQTWVQWRSATWFRARGGDYVLKDVRKLAGKWYEQDYTRMPRGWRTFRSHQLAFTAREHQEHENKAWTVCTAKPGAPWYEQQREIWVERVDWHVPRRCGCRLYERRGRRGHASQRDSTMALAREGTIKIPGPFDRMEPRAENSALGSTGLHEGAPELYVPAGAYTTGTTRQMFDLPQKVSAAETTSGARVRSRTQPCSRGRGVTLG